MARYVWDRTVGKFVTVEQLTRRPVARSHLPCPAIVADGMDAICSQADGIYYDSKSAYYKGLKHAGCEIDDRPYDPKAKSYTPSGVGQDIKDAFDQIEGI